MGRIRMDKFIRGNIEIVQEEFKKKLISLHLEEIRVILDIDWMVVHDITINF